MINHNSEETNYNSFDSDFEETNYSRSARSDALLAKNLF